MEQRIIALFGVVAAAVFIAGCVGQEGQLAFFTGEIAGGEKEEISLSAEHIETARENKDFTLNLLLRPKVDLQDARVDVYDSCLFVNITQQEFFFPKLKANKTEVMKAKYRLGAIDFEQDCELKIRAEYTGNFSVVQTVTVLQEEEFVRVGGLEPIPLTARIVAATHCDLRRLVSEGRFREDLFYRLSVSSLYMPSLRERQTDIPLLAEALLEKIAAKFQCRRLALSGDALQKLLAYDWPGNVRELENVLTRATALAVDTVLTAEDLQLASPGSERQAAVDCGARQTTLAEAEKRHVKTTLDSLRWNITKVAKQLAISPTTLRKKISDYELLNPFT